jgi:tetrahydromethanopterin S-methyltransferase subunit C
MDKQVAELIKTLNGGLQHLPDLAKEMIHQYVIGHAFLGIVFLVMAIALLVGYFHALKTSKDWQKDSFSDVSEAMFVFPAIAGLLTMLGIANVYRACTPIWSIIQSLT